MSWDANKVSDNYVGESISQGDFHRYLTRLGTVDEVILNSERSVAKVVFADAKTCGLVKSLPKIEIRGRLMRHVTMRVEPTKVARPVPADEKSTPLSVRTEFPQDCNLVIKNLCPAIT
jgi:hypothetical protein